MLPIRLKIGDTILATHDILNDGSFPEAEENEILVPKGSRGVIIEEGYLEEDETKALFLVKFECHDNPAELGPPIGCWPEDISPLPDTLPVS